MTHDGHVREWEIHLFTPHPCCNTQAAGTAPRMGNTAELPMMRGGSTQPWCYEHRKTSPITHLTCGSIPSPAFHAWDRWGSWPWDHNNKRSVPTPHQLQHLRSGRANPEDLKEGVLATLLHLCCNSRSSQGNAGELILALSIVENCQTDQPYICSGPDPGLWLGPPQHPYYL